MWIISNELKHVIDMSHCLRLAILSCIFRHIREATFLYGSSGWTVNKSIFFCFTWFIILNIIISHCVYLVCCNRPFVYIDSNNLQLQLAATLSRVQIQGVKWIVVMTQQLDMGHWQGGGRAVVVEGVQPYVTPGAYPTLPGSHSNTPHFSWRAPSPWRAPRHEPTDIKHTQNHTTQKDTNAEKWKTRSAHESPST